MINIETTLDSDFQDSGPFRSYELIARGNSIEELLKDAWIFEIDQDGGECSDYELSKATNRLYDLANRIIVREYSAQLMKGIL